MRRLRTLIIAAAAALATGSSAGAVTGPACVPGGPWTRTIAFTPDHSQSVGPWSNQTLRMVAHGSLGGTQLRIDLTNVLNPTSVTFAHVSVAPQLNQAQAAATPTAVTFGGAYSVTMAAGADAQSDAVALPTTPGERLLVSVYIPASESVSSANLHAYSGETEYNIVGSDATMATAPTISNTFTFDSFLSGVDVDASSALTVVAAGDSITDLGGSPVDADARWPDYLARRVPTLAVANAGISGNWVTADQGTNGGQSLTNRWSRDVLGVPGVRTVIDEGGVNDLRGGVSAASLESAQASLVASAHAAGLRILLTTITPCAGASLCTSAFETQRQAYNAWVRAGTSGADGVADFSAAVSNGTALDASFDSGDHLHMDAAGMLAMAQVIDTSKL